MENTDPFQQIGTLMTEWANRLAGRDQLRNDDIKQEIATRFSRTPDWDLTNHQRKEKQQLIRSVRPVRTVAYLKKTMSAAPSVFSGSPRMDTGAAFMLLATHADLQMKEDKETSDALLELVKQAKPQTVLDPESPIPTLPGLRSMGGPGRRP